MFTVKTGRYRYCKFQRKLAHEPLAPRIAHNLHAFCKEPSSRPSSKSSLFSDLCLSNSSTKSCFKGQSATAMAPTLEKH